MRGTEKTTWVFELQVGPYTTVTRQKDDSDFSELQKRTDTTVVRAFLLRDDMYGGHDIVGVVQLDAKQITKTFIRHELSSNASADRRIPAIEYITAEGKTMYCFVIDGYVVLTEDSRYYHTGG